MTKKMILSCFCLTTKQVEVWLNMKGSVMGVLGGSGLASYTG